MSDKPKVLLVEDDPAHRELLAARFRSAGYPVITASEGPEALKAADGHPFDVLVSDIHLPGLSGLDLLRTLGDRHPTILISGALTPVAREEAVSEGAKAVFAKPVAWPDLMRAVDEAFREERPRRALVADDHGATRTLLEEILRREGYEVDLATDGQEALEKTLQTDRPYDLLITDILMPRLNGPEVIRKIRKIHHSTRIVFTTGGGSRQEIRDCYLGGGISLWRKPFDLKTLVAEVRRLKAAPAEDPVENETEAFSLWFDGVRRKIRKDKSTKMVLRGAGMIALAGFLLVVILGSIMHFQGTLGSALERVGSFMDRVEGYLDRDEQREIQRDQGRPR